jgi:ATP-dependent DNA helicase RecG
VGKMLKLCSLAGIPVPHFEEYQSGFLVEFRKNIYTEEYLRKLGLNERQIKAVMYVKERGRITNKEYQELTNISRNSNNRYIRNGQKECVREDRQGRQGNCLSIALID